MKKLNILMIHPHDIYSAKEPWTIRIIEIARIYKKIGHNVKLIYFPLPKKERGKLKSEKIIEFETIPFSRRSYHIFNNIFRIQKLARWSDVIHVQKCFPNAVFPALIGSLIHKKHLHYDWDDNEYEIYNFSAPSKLFGNYLGTMEKTMPKLVDSMSVASYKLKELAMELKFPEKKIAMAHVGVNLNRFNPKKSGKEIRKKYKLRKKVVLYLGQLNGAQYAQLVIKSYKQILIKRKDVSLLIVGGGSNLQDLKDFTKSQELEKDVVFTGFVHDDEVPKCIAAADVAVASFEKNKITECKSPLKIVEYLGSGKAIVASDVGEVKRMVGDSGFVVEPGNVEEITKKVMHLLDDEILRKQFEKNARIHAIKKFNWDITAKNILDVYF
ncbi:glycosyltransferase family 4 protein [archaeon]|jgi:glycosyltransferase involved in cell wall biosynthesis|nr:glycosyltransferase family 4 protein [archaeon]MBT4022065.1 glycosyltransferase family 4 protein [archaeon]MBT4272678.1 glycosyltransferase family 4 protein [archaeon]MBT4461476.1 glycosyltransferase family 4 protein [archaeon]MBT4857754.1 glycosyltransferase family 4 protein [archaeon]